MLLSTTAMVFETLLGLTEYWLPLGKRESPSVSGTRTHDFQIWALPLEPPSIPKLLIMLMMKTFGRSTKSQTSFSPKMASSNDWSSIEVDSAFKWRVPRLCVGWHFVFVAVDLSEKTLMAWKLGASDYRAYPQGYDSNLQLVKFHGTGNLDLY